MLHLFRRKEIQQPAGIEIKQSPLHGLGVFACQVFKPGAVIETAPVILMEQQDKDFLQTTMLFSYYFVVGDVKFPVVLGLGYSSLFNHSYQANAEYSISLKGSYIKIKACKTINPGEEIMLNYNGNPDDATPVFFANEESAI
ncbi:MAG: SET domain-containing protein-lysine N-methyltransferase [Chitinophagaceae bacterium]|nr:SET domain-containing protein-lysine N-methyltransferase [Chitinophagaceae bacterium]